MPNARTQDEIWGVLFDAYVTTYEELPRQFRPETRIREDLRIQESDQVYVLDWMHETAKRLAINERDLPKPRAGRDYTLAEIAGAFMIA